MGVSSMPQLWPPIRLLGQGRGDELGHVAVTGPGQRPVAVEEGQLEGVAAGEVEPW
jgi:hypothetical protein